MKEIDANKDAWSKVSKEHYETFKRKYLDGSYKLNKYIQEEIGDINGKTLIHLQCNTGADSIKLAQMGASVVGVDLVPDNVFYAKKLASELDIKDINFIESDIMKLSEIHHDKYDIAFTSEGAIGWLPDLKKWGRTIRSLLKDDGFLYIFEAHPFYLTMDESKFSKDELEIKYPYFDKTPDIDYSIGGYASESKQGVTTYYWMYTVSDVVNALTSAGLHIHYFNEYEEYICDMGGMKKDENKGLFYYDFNKGKYPMSFSLKASVYDR